MDCNKEEAIRAMQLSEEKLQNKDFAGAKKMAQTAQRLFPELQNISQLLTACEVHCSAENKIGGSEMDWYGVLQIQQFDNDESVKKQFRKLALLLHPDKNKFVGAEAAFKLIVEANSVLADQGTRFKYDKKYRKALAKASKTVSCSVPRYHKGKATLYPESKAGMAADAGPSNTVKKDIKHGNGVSKQGIESSRFDPRSKDLGPSRNMNKKRGRSSSFESTQSSKRGKRATADSEVNGCDHLRKSSGSKQNPSSSEKLNHYGGLVNPPKGLRQTGSSSFQGKKSKNAAKNCRILKNDRPTDSGTNSVVASPPKVIKVPDPEFNKFSPVKKSITVNQTWALYDEVDGMPRFYAHIKKVYSSGFKVKITWLIPHPGNKGEEAWVKKDLPVACGKFKLGLTEDITDLLMFSHQMHCTKGSAKAPFLVYPRKGETWALFKNWNIGWSSDPAKHKPFDFEFVEILSDFSKSIGTEVVYVAKVKGFLSMFKRNKQRGVVSFQIPPHELYRFSHRIPSFKMSGGEKRGVPKDSFEFDPASLPSD
ncbi:uncharacterized protein LOC126798053 [Argentina anserina]|uniref:uncharacterized protein LOC126798053 n=1 Tax=Argentina anserina TaxID=57926 RepID=UPI002176788D|nr:uncharacterized protein LOC126798053 [Potentilla anserina]XP_050380834.1 uncharacterized protein LOC126798053 [Potentilla anserina]